MEIVIVVSVILVLLLYFMRGKFKYKNSYNESLQNCARAITEIDQKEGPWNLLFISEFTNQTSNRKKRNKIFLFKNQKEKFIFVKEPSFQPSGNKDAVPVDAMKTGDWYNIIEEIDAREDCSYFFFKQLLSNNTKRESKEVLTVVNSNET